MPQNRFIFLWQFDVVVHNILRIRLAVFAGEKKSIQQYIYIIHLYVYYYFCMSNVSVYHPQALELAALATEACQFKDWWWKVQLAKCYYRYISVVPLKVYFVIHLLFSLYNSILIKSSTIQMFSLSAILTADVTAK